MIVGIGVDVVEIARVTKLCAQGTVSGRFAQRILTPKELEEYQQLLEKGSKPPERFLAKRFAVKEAAAKALGTGFRKGLRYQHIGVEHDALGKPLLTWHDVGDDVRQCQGVTVSHVSISDEQAYVVAMVLLANE